MKNDKIVTVENPLAIPRAGHEDEFTTLISSDMFSDPTFHPSSEMIRERADLCSVNLKNRIRYEEFVSAMRIEVIGTVAS